MTNTVKKGVVLAISFCMLGGALITNMDAFGRKHEKAAIVSETPAAEGFVETRTGLKYEDSAVGSGSEAKAGDTVSVHYTGTLYPTGEKFDSSVDRGEPFSFELGAGRVIAGWDEGVAGMREGGKRTLVIPGGLAYGRRGVPGVIPPNATLKFDVELLKVR